MPEMTEEQRKELEEKIKKMSPEELKEFQKQQCIFCQIISGKIPSKKIYEDDKSIAVLDINPASKGHILIMPKEHFAIMPQIPEKELGHLILVVKSLSQILLRALKSSGTSVFIANGFVAGQKAQHFMIHLIPRKEGDGILEVEEKLLSKEMVLKVKTVIEKKINELLGIKKEVVKPLPEFEKNEKLEEKNKAENKDKTEEVEEEKSSEEKEEIPLEKPAATEVKKKKTKSTKVKEQTEEEPPETKVSKEDISLDDIANLFK